MCIEKLTKVDVVYSSTLHKLLTPSEIAKWEKFLKDRKAEAQEFKNKFKKK